MMGILNFAVALMYIAISWTTNGVAAALWLIGAGLWFAAGLVAVRR